MENKIRRSLSYPLDNTHPWYLPVTSPAAPEENNIRKRRSNEWINITDVDINLMRMNLLFSNVSEKLRRITERPSEELEISKK
uniref:Uncharacterized protein n=1 Tax=viral metagenome TaxID=1070528 RepID=A0A6C0KV14_9ZZZZ